MKKLIFFIVSGGLVLLFGTKVYAQTTGVDNPNRPVFRVFDNKTGGSGPGGVNSGGASGAGNLRARVDARRKELIERFFNRMLSRFEAAIGRLDRLINRISSRLAKIKATGVDTSALDAQLGAARDKLTVAKNDLAALRASGVNFSSSDDPKTAFALIKQKIGLLRDEIKGVHQALVQIVTQIKGLRVGEATSSGQIKITAKPTIKPSTSASPSGSL